MGKQCIYEPSECLETGGVMSSNKVLIVDDDPELLKSFQRHFHGVFDLDVAPSGMDGIESVNRQGPYTVVISDYRMPGMDGVEFLRRVRDLSPDSIRIILTGYPDIDTAVKAVNEGRVFRFLTKPVRTEIIAHAITDGIKFYELEKAERELHSLKRWRKSMEAMILAFMRLVEARDPYTAGHQQKVAKLSKAIAEELGLEKVRVEGINMAAAIHDIGKLYVPAEILNRPGKLSKIECDMIKLHSRVAFDILSPIDFEYPVARIIHQHHERMNGSGYPLGLKGDHILLEARIIAVADVVEAMSSHRPYRPALGLEAALGEISKNKGVLYDPDVADICQRLFEAEAFAFEE